MLFLLLISESMQCRNIYKTKSANVCDCRDILFLIKFEISLTEASCRILFFVCMNYQPLKVKKQIPIFIIILSICIWNGGKKIRKLLKFKSSVLSEMHLTLEEVKGRAGEISAQTILTSSLGIPRAEKLWRQWCTNTSSLLTRSPQLR